MGPSSGHGGARPDGGRRVGRCAAALIRCLESLPAERSTSRSWSASIAAPRCPERLPACWRRHSPLPVAYGIDDEPLLPRRVYLAPPGSSPARERRAAARRRAGRASTGFRPAIDPLFRTAAREHGAARRRRHPLRAARRRRRTGLALVKRHGGVGDRPAARGRRIRRHAGERPRRRSTWTTSFRRRGSGRSWRGWRTEIVLRTSRRRMSADVAELGGRATARQRPPGVTSSRSCVRSAAARSGRAGPA